MTTLDRRRRKPRPSSTSNIHSQDTKNEMEKNDYDETRLQKVGASRLRKDVESDVSSPTTNEDSTESNKLQAMIMGRKRKTISVKVKLSSITVKKRKQDKKKGSSQKGKIVHNENDDEAGSKLNVAELSHNDDDEEEEKEEEWVEDEEEKNIEKSDSFKNIKRKKDDDHLSKTTKLEIRDSDSNCSESDDSDIQKPWLDTPRKDTKVSFMTKSGNRNTNDDDDMEYIASSISTQKNPHSMAIPKKKKKPNDQSNALEALTSDTHGIQKQSKQKVSSNSLITNMTPMPSEKGAPSGISLKPYSIGTRRNAIVGVREGSSAVSKNNTSHQQQRLLQYSGIAQKQKEQEAPGQHSPKPSNDAPERESQPRHSVRGDKILKDLNTIIDKVIFHHQRSKIDVGKGFGDSTPEISSNLIGHENSKPKVPSATNSNNEMFGSFIPYTDEEKYDFFDRNEDGTPIIKEPKIPIFPEDFKDGQKEWPLNWWGILSPPDNILSIHNEDRRPSCGDKERRIKGYNNRDQMNPRGQEYHQIDSNGLMNRSERSFNNYPPHLPYSRGRGWEGQRFPDGSRRDWADDGAWRDWEHGRERGLSGGLGRGGPGWLGGSYGRHSNEPSFDRGPARRHMRRDGP